MEKLIITAAICGAEVTKEHNPAVPYTVEELVREAVSAYDAGAAIVHVHVREDDGTPTQSKERFRMCMDAIKAARPDVILLPSTGGAVGMTAEERLQPTELFPEMATLDCGTCNFGDEVFENTIPMMRDFGKRMIENDIKPEYECFEMGHLETALHLAAKGQVPGAPMQFNFVLGVPGCADGEPAPCRINMDSYRNRTKRIYPCRTRHCHGRPRTRRFRRQPLFVARRLGKIQRRTRGQSGGNGKTVGT